MYIKPLDEQDQPILEQRRKTILKYQDQGVCFSCQNFITDDIFPKEDLVIYEDALVRCQFEKFPRAVGQIIIIAKHHYEDMSEMPLDLGIHILKLSQKIIQLQKQILGAQKVYLCTICDGKRNHLHFQLLPRLQGESIGYQNFVKPEGRLMDYEKEAELFREAMADLSLD